MNAPYWKLGISTEIVDGSLMVAQIRYLAKHEQTITPKNSLAKLAKQQIEAYLSEPGYEFNLPLKPQGSLFQNTVWMRICAIPTGSLLTYGQLAQEINSGARAVGGACAANYYPLVIPCHRILAKSHLGGFVGQSSGWQIEIKQWLLKHEGVCID